ncbi:MAG: putative DNA binding domain-containing protein [Deferribacteraceae bacterium]|nr:putative DNA binding domain-containing protein [Deferribacteraceae bacterium]
MLYETNRIEYKEKLSHDLEEEAVAFLNAEGGDIFIGIRKDGSVAGVANPDETQLKIADRLCDNIRPNIMGLFDISTDKRDGKDIIIINFASGTEKPYCIKRKGYSEAGCFIRIGSSTQPMSQEIIDSMLSKRHPLSLANIPSRHQDLEFDQLKLYYGLNKKPLNDNFPKTLDFLTPDGKYNMVAFLFADNNNISVRVGKYSGTDKEDLIEREDFKDCSLITAMKKVIDRLDMENVTQSHKRPMRTRIDKSLVNKDVLHEAIINAFAHNDYSRNLDTPIFQIYSDRFEVMSFGGLVEGMTTEQFYTGTSMPRNREIVRVFKDLDYMEQLGSGIPKIVKKYGRDAIAIDSFIIQATLKFDTGSEILATTDSPTNKIIIELKQNPYITMDVLAEKVGLTIHGIKWHMDKLKKQGTIRRLGAKNGGYWELIQS